MDDQGNTAGVQEPGPSFVSDVETLSKRVGEGLKDDAERLVDRVLGAGTAAKVETVAAEGVVLAADAGAAAVAAIRAFGAGHVNLSQLSLTAELAAAKTKVEEAIVALARHIAGLSSSN